MPTTPDEHPGDLRPGRSALLEEAGLVDLSADATLDRLNRLAVELLGVPVSLVTVVDDDRQFFVGQAGLPQPWAAYRATPLTHSFCKHVVAREAPLVIPDTRRDELVSDNPAVRDLGVAAYAGVPLRLRSGGTLGAFCAIDLNPRHWTDHDLEILSDLAEVASDAIELRKALASSALHDHLTGLPNRALFGELVERALQGGSHDESAPAIFALRLDRLNTIIDALGPGAGDAIVRSVAERLMAAVRPDDAICRSAGGDFLVLCPQVGDEAHALRIAQRLRRAVEAEACRVEGRDQFVGATVGVAVHAAPEGAGADELIHTAMEALGGLEPGTREKVERADPGRRHRARERLDLGNAVAGAHERGEMHVVYQPLVELATRRMLGVEALVRWQHPRLGLVAPARFIPAAEASGEIVALGEWVLRQACRDLAALRRHHGLRELELSVNVAPTQMSIASFPDVVADALAQARLSPSALTLEITERTLLDDRAGHHRTMRALGALGVELALDDFGTGYSSLAFLTRFPVDVLKIDRSFISGLRDEPRAAALVSGILGLAQGLGLRTVAEGIEDGEQLDALVALGCEIGQGYLFSRPLAVDQVPRASLEAA